MVAGVVLGTAAIAAASGLLYIYREPIINAFKSPNQKRIDEEKEEYEHEKKKEFDQNLDDAVDKGIFNVGLDAVFGSGTAEKVFFDIPFEKFSKSKLAGKTVTHNGLNIEIPENTIVNRKSGRVFGASPQLTLTTKQRANALAARRNNLAKRNDDING